MRLFKFRKKDIALRDKEVHLLSDKTPFAIQEAYKALRTNLIFSMPEDGCKTILITSSVQGEAKSTTAVNLAIAFAQNGNKVLLIDCDLRLPTDAAKLKVKGTTGLTDVLVGMNSINEVIRALPTGMHFLPAGTVPPNPTELLGSDQMSMLLRSLRNHYEYIVLDTPPINAVADAAILSGEASGVAIVVRQNMATEESIDSAISALEFAGARILGFIFTGVENEKQNAYRKSGYYGYGYAQSAARANKK